MNTHTDHSPYLAIIRHLNFRKKDEIERVFGTFHYNTQSLAILDISVSL